MLEDSWWLKQLWRLPDDLAQRNVPLGNIAAARCAVGVARCVHRVVYARWSCPEVYDLAMWVSSLVKFQDALDAHLMRLRHLDPPEPVEHHDPDKVAVEVACIFTSVDFVLQIQK